MTPGSDMGIYPRLPRPIFSGHTTLPLHCTVYRAANTLVKRWGEDAQLEAASKADAMIECGDPEGLAVWKRILRAVDELLRTKPADTERRH